MKYAESEDRLRSVVEDLTEIISRIDADGTILYVNEVYCRFFGKPRQELVGRKWHPAAVAEDVPMVEAQLATLSPENPVVVLENRVYSASGAVHWFQFVNRALFDTDGRLVEIQGVGRDITALKQAEAALWRSKERLNLALSASHMGVWEWDVVNDAIFWSPECYELFQRPDFPGTLDGFLEVVHPDDVDLLMATARGSLADGTDFGAEFRVVYPNGELRWMKNHGRPSYDRDGRPVRLGGTVVDITERRRAEEHLNRLNEKMSDLSAHLETVREQERLSISREIHDEIGQTLTALKLDLSWIYHRVAPAQPELADRLGEMRKGLDYLIAKAQHITAELRPPLLDNLGLTAAIEWQVRQFRKRSGINCRFVAPQSTLPLDEKSGTAVMRIFQEAMTNILRHAQATLVQVSLYFGADYLELEVADNGTGISAEEIASATAYGVMGMQERARLCHGELEISGTPGKGTTVTLTIPLGDAAASATEAS